MSPLIRINQMIEIADTIKTAMQQAEEEEHFRDQEYNDLTHALEFTKFNASEGYRLAKEIQENRNSRRRAKNQMEQLKPLYDLLNKHSNFFRDLKKVHADIETTIHHQQKREYRPRVRDDLFEKVTP